MNWPPGDRWPVPEPTAALGGLRVTRIRVYPLKGAAGFDLVDVVLGALGIPWDRRWMLVDERGAFVSQRSHPKLALVRVEPLEEKGAFRIRVPGMEPATLSAEEREGPWRSVRLHQEDLRVPTVAPEIGSRISRFLGGRLQLVHLPDEVHRSVDPSRAPGHRVGFADAYPLLVATEESLSDVCRRAGTDFSMLRFRPNLVMAGGRPWEEDEWRSLEIGTARLDMVKPCARCNVVTVDPGTGARGVEPLRTLSAFRRWGGKSWFGQNAVVSSSGSFRVGDSVDILEKGAPRPPPA